MAAARAEDRQIIGRLHSIPRPQRNLRDASRVWQQDPTPILPPERGSSTSNLEQNRSNGHSPWSRSVMQNNPRTTKIGNSTARSTVTTLRAQKRRKVEPESPYFAMGKGTSHNSNRRPLTAPEITVVDDKEEDLGTIVTTDELNIIDVDSPWPPSRTTINRLKSISSPAVTGPSSGSRFVRDGSATRKLEKNLDIESDPIGYFPDDSPPASEHLFPMSVPCTVPHKGTVQEKILKIEKEVRAVPRVDLRSHQGHVRGIKNQMKLKQFSAAHVHSQHDAFATAASLSTSSRPTTPQLRVKEWYLGTDHKDSNAGYSLSWEKDTMTFSQGRSSPAIHFDVVYELESIKYFEYTSGSHIKYPIIAMQTYPPKNSLRLRNSEHFKMGDKHAKGAITVKFDMNSNNWAKGYQAFINWIKDRVDNKFIINDMAARSVWEVAERCGELGVIDVQRKKRRNSVEEVQPDEQRRSLKRPASVESLYWQRPPPDGKLVANTSDCHSTSQSNSRAGTKPPSVSSRDSNALSVAPSRSSCRSTRQREVSPEADPDEVILCYPQGVTGAVNITNADFRRLQPGEFLNDTLIEFGLKLWLRKLEESSPEVANQVHVFSSFFYKKLNKKDINEGYQSVRKWTAKLDIFSKKFLIVPINENLHWYLAIVYQPELILLRPLPSPPPPPLKETRLRAHHAEASERSAIRSKPSMTDTNLPSPPLPDDLFAAQETSSEVAVERDLQQFETSCSIVSASENSSHTTSTPSAAGDTTMDEQDPLEYPSSPLSVMDVDNHNQHMAASREPSLTVSNYAQRAGSINVSTPDVDMIDISPSSSQEEVNHTLKLFDKDIEHASHYTAVAPENFYTTSKAKGKQGEIPQPQPSIEVGDDDEEGVELSSKPLTYIFTMDSLGGRHPAAIKRLQKYLHLEAEDKRKLSKTSEARGKQAIVPVQPNFCDCGLYLLHFAETFVNDPAKYCRIITETTNKTSNEVRRDDWNDAKTAGMRERLMHEITKLSAVWKKDRAEREEAKKSEVGPTEVVDSSDDEVDIVDVTPIVPEKGKGKGKGKGKSSPAKGKAARIRSG